MTEFAENIIAWHALHGRHDLPWQKPATAYRVWVSEVMLQQTQVKTVIPYFNRFISRFENIKSLALAKEDEVLNYWSGLGYYARARNLLQTARILHEHYQENFPSCINDLCKLPGIGRSTAGAILSLAQGQSTPILDGNVKRILSRVHAVPGWPGNSKILETLWQLSEQYTPQTHTAIYNQAMMDIGATICTRRHPKCSHCPIAQNCIAFALNQQHDFPTPKPRKQLPQKSTFMLIILNEKGEILLIKRPPSGIWGGLWSFPEHDDELNIFQFVMQNFNFKVNKIQIIPSIYHQFTHFGLTIQPRILKISPSENRKIMEQAAFLWYKEEDQKLLGLARPVQKLLKQVKNFTDN